MDNVIKKNLSNHKSAILTLWIMFGVLVFWSCQTQNEENESFSAMKDTKWKLEGIWYEESKIFKVIEPVNCLGENYNYLYNEEVFTMLIFDSDSTAKGYAGYSPVTLVFSEKTVSVITQDRTGGCADELFYHDSLVGVITYSINDDEMKLFFYEPICIQDWEGLGIEVPVHSLESYLLFKKVK